MDIQEKTIRCRQLQSQYMIDMALADTYRSDGQYSPAGLAYISQSAKIQLQLSQLTDGDTARLHRQEAQRLIALLKKQNCAPDIPVSQEAPPAAHSAQKPAAPAARTKDDELPAGFDPASFIMAPSEDSLDSVHANRDLVLRICNSFRDKDRLQRLFPNATGHWPQKKPRPTNILLYGPAATGKTHLCRCISNHIASQFPGESAFYYVSGMMISSKYVGQTGRILKAIFDDARRFKHAVICVDEIEEMCGDRSADSNKTNYTTNFLELLDGVSGKSNATFIACTNYPWLMDQAMLSRLHVRSMIDYPNREDILVYFRNSPQHLDCMGSDAASAEAMAAKIAGICAERHFSFRNLETLCDLIFSRAEENALQCYPDGNADLKRIPPLSEEALLHLIDLTDSDYNEANYNQYIRYLELNRAE